METVQTGRIRVGVVNYLNTRPLLYGLQRPPAADLMILSGDYPARVAERLVAGEIDLGLVPVAALPDLPSYRIVGTHCIGTEGEIASVALFSEAPLQEIETVYLDYQSRTSVALLRFLMREYWDIHPRIIHAQNEDYRHQLTGTTAGLVIGDRAFEQRKQSTFIYDLGSEWRKITGLPFVFAVWAAVNPLPEGFEAIFDQANEWGLSRLEEITAGIDFPLYDLHKYYSLHLSYRLDERKRRSMELFLETIRLAAE